MVRLVLVLIGGIGLLGATLHTDGSDPAFFPLSFALAAWWALGAWWSGLSPWAPVVEGQPRMLIQVQLPIVAGLLTVGLFTAAAFLFRGLPGFSETAAGLTDRAFVNPVAALSVALVAGAAEEMFFRGPLFRALTTKSLRLPPIVQPGTNRLSWVIPAMLRREVWVTAIIYTVVTAASNNLPLTAAALVLGLVTGTVRERSGGVLAPIIVHAVWTTGMFFILPNVFS